MTGGSARARRGRRWQDPILAEAARRFPDAFASFGSRPHPLKLRVERDLGRFMPELSNNQIRQSLATYCGTRWYLEALASGGERVDLFGRPSGAVDETARRRALDRLMAADPSPEPSPSPPASDRRPRLGIKGEAGLDVRLAIARSRGYRV